MKVGQFQKVTCKGYATAAMRRLNYQQQPPAIQKSYKRMKGLAQISILPTDFRARRCQLRPNECGGERDESTSAQTARSKMSCERGERLPRVHENSRADDAAHHQHGGVE